MVAPEQDDTIRFRIVDHTVDVPGGRAHLRVHLGPRIRIEVVGPRVVKVGYRHGTAEKDDSIGLGVIGKATRIPGRRRGFGGHMGPRIVEEVVGPDIIQGRPPTKQDDAF